VREVPFGIVGLVLARVQAAILADGQGAAVGCIPSAAFPCLLVRRMSRPYRANLLVFDQSE
jgi:hypothetical protein